jgi:hypothetical protein
VISLTIFTCRCSRIGNISFDQENGLRYVLELYADGTKPVVHVWRVKPQ